MSDYSAINSTIICTDIRAYYSRFSPKVTSSIALSENDFLIGFRRFFFRLAEIKRTEHSNGTRRPNTPVHFGFGRT